MTTLHIDLTVNDLATFRTKFAEHADLRRTHGVVADRVTHVADDDHRLQIELDFASAEEAEAFLGFLRQGIWKDNPTLVGTPQATLLEPLAYQPA